jgi:hypothetical protein
MSRYITSSQLNKLGKKQANSCAGNAPRSLEEEINGRRREILGTTLGDNFNSGLQEKCSVTVLGGGL